MDKPDPMSIECFVKKLLKPYLRYDIPYDDLYQAGMLGATIAANHYDETKGAYTTVAAHWIRDELNKLCFRREQETVEGKIVNHRFPHSDMYIPTDPQDLLIEDCESNPINYALAHSDRKLINSIIQTIKSTKHKEFIIEKLNTGDVIGCANKYYDGDRAKAVKRCGSIFRYFIRNAKEALSENRNYITYYGKAAPDR